MSWNGYKLHLDASDIGLPSSALVTSASLHYSQVAIPLIKLTSSKVTLHLMFGVFALFAGQLLRLVA